MQSATGRGAQSVLASRRASGVRRDDFSTPSTCRARRTRRRSTSRDSAAVRWGFESYRPLFGTGKGIPRVVRPAVSMFFP
jgi:hypothetical protein